MSTEYKGLTVDEQLLKDLAAAMAYPRAVRAIMVGKAIYEWIERQQDTTVGAAIREWTKRSKRKGPHASRLPQRPAQ